MSNKSEKRILNNDIDGGKSLQEIVGEDWGEPTYPSYLVTTTHALRRKPLREFTTEDLRIMIGQNFSLPILVPLALEILEKDLLASGDLFDGDLLDSVTRRIESSFWLEHPDLRAAVESLLQQELFRNYSEEELQRTDVQERLSAASDAYKHLERELRKISRQ
jgi:hypothetical protein